MEQDASKDDDIAEIRLDAKEAVVLFELLSRWSDPKATHTPDKLCFESPAECAVLNGLLGDLEKQLAAPFKPEYRQILADARSFLAGRWNDPTLRG
ncbi:hypothetical protein [Rhizobium multihospitium]|uniref:Uncharacterized protein n=3 Tax=Rhizobium TaxID=379 RepID=A0A1C3WIB9_9HYPH|nr:hypothetical protein [Rhizobium multihospitium]SCB39596.1 hypothetical protein GA0061103_5541 [Rhizobium multihospitium]